MLLEGSGNLLECEAEALVNPVNIVGVMGKGLALQFRQAYPENYKQYRRACKCGEVQLGTMFVTRTSSKFIVNFPTKEHWKSKSQIEDVKAGLLDLVCVVKEQKIQSIAIPPLGCGLGGLSWEDVLPEIEKAFKDLPDIEVILFPPMPSGS